MDLIKVPFVDLKAQYHSIKPEIDIAIERVISETAFIGGKYVTNFKSEFESIYGVSNCIPVANGTDAIYITLKTLGIKEGDEVITVANSWISTSETISQTGATPVFVDVDEFYTIDVTKIREKVTPRTKAIIPVHLYGQMCNMDEIKGICDEFDLFLVEDCAQSHFSEYKGKRAGLFGNAATFSFFPGKNLGAYGDAGAIITNDENLAEKMLVYANHGAKVKHEHLIEGINSRLDGLQASILSAKLPHIIKWTEMRIKCASLYNEILEDIPQIQLPRIRKNTTHSFHLYVIQAEQRDKLSTFLKVKGIETAIHYPSPLPFMEAYKYLKINKTDFPKVKENQSKILSIPIYPELTPNQQEYVADQIKTFYKQY